MKVMIFKLIKSTMHGSPYKSLVHQTTGTKLVKASQSNWVKFCQSDLPPVLNTLCVRLLPNICIIKAPFIKSALCQIGKRKKCNYHTQYREISTYMCNFWERPMRGRKKRPDWKQRENKDKERKRRKSQKEKMSRKGSETIGKHRNKKQKERSWKRKGEEWKQWERSKSRKETGSRAKETQSRKTMEEGKK